MDATEGTWTRCSFGKRWDKGNSMNKSESIKELAAALIMAQSDLKNPTFDSNNPHYKSKFASLAQVRDTVTPVLAKHRLAVIQLLGEAEGGIRCETVLMHSSGEWLSSVLFMPATKQDAQGYGSASTYARRYSLQAICGVVGDEDDDGNAASNPKPSKPLEAAKGPITPNDGAMEALTEKDRATAQKVANSIVDYFTEGKELSAYEAFYQSNHSNEMQLAIWEVLKPHSAIRRQLKSMHDTSERKAA
jgi:hypothetical protein